MKFKKFVFSMFECEHKVFLIMFAFYFLGFLYGIFFTSKNGGQTSFDLGYLNDSNQFVKSFLFLFLIFIFGYTPFGVPVIVFLISYNGICFGIIIANIVIEYGMIGAVLSSIFLYLYFLLNIISITILSFSSLRLSLVIFNQFRNNNRYVSPKIYSGAHIMKFVFYTFITIFSNSYFSFFALPIMTNFF